MVSTLRTAKEVGFITIQEGVKRRPYMKMLYDTPYVCFCLILTYFVENSALKHSYQMCMLSWCL